MSAPPIKQEVLNCQAKRRYPDEYTARASALFALSENWRAPALWIYRCPHCKGWHLTSLKKANRMKITREEMYHDRAED